MTSVTFSACKKFVTLQFFSLKKRVSLVAQVKDLCSQAMKDEGVAGPGFCRV